MRKVISITAALFVISLMPSLSYASLVSGPFVTTTPIAPTLTDWVDTLSFPKFDSSLGTLQKVELNLCASMSTVLTITNVSPTGSSGTAKTEMMVSVQDAGNNLIVPQIDILSPHFSYNLGPGETITSGTLTKNGGSCDQYTSAAVLSAFNGPGTIILDASTFTQTVLANTGGNTTSSQVTNAELTGNVTYYYIPEPVSMLLLGMGSLYLLPRRKK